MKTLLILLTAALLLAGSAFAQTPAPTLIPFQGRLTDQSGVAYTNNQYTIVFQLYDQAVGGTLLWSERHEKVGVLNGMVNVFLGSISSLGGVNFSTTRYLGITVDGDNNPNTPDPEMVPRQMIIPAFWAKNADNATKMGGFGWNDLLANNATNPSTGSISGAKIAAGTITGASIASGTLTGSQLASGTVTGVNIADNAIGSGKIATGAVGTNQIQDGSITLVKLAGRQVGSDVDAGGIAISPSTGDWAIQPVEKHQFSKSRGEVSR